MTSPRPTVTVGFDATAEAHTAVHWAAHEAVVRGALLRIVSAWDPSPVTPWSAGLLAEWRDRARAEAEQAVSSARDAVGGGLDVEGVAREGDAGAVLVNESSTCDLLVLGSTGHIGFGGLLAGSVSRHCLHHTRSPLVILGPNAHQDETTRLVLSSTLDERHETFGWVADRLRERPVPVHVIGSFDAMMGLAELAVTQAHREIRAAVQAEQDLWVSELRTYLEASGVGPVAVTATVLEGPTQHILDSQTGPGDLIVVPSGCEHAVPLARGACPIAVIPPHRRAKAGAVRPQLASEVPLTVPSVP